MKIVIWGAGGIGAALGAMLARSGAHVTLICRGAQLAAIRQHGLRVVGAAGEFSIHNLAVTDDPRTVGPVDVILPCVKRYDLAAVAKRMPVLVHSRTMVVPIQNGVTAHEEIAAAIGSAHVIGGTVFMSSRVRAPGVIEFKSERASITFGELHGGVSERVRMFAQCCESADIQAHAVRDIRAALWHKFIMLGGTAAVCCLSRRSIGEIRADVLLRGLLIRAMREVLALAQAREIAVDASCIDEAMAFTDRLEPATKVSMLEDLEAGRPLELEWITGHIVREARAAGVATPIHDIAYSCLRIAASPSRANADRAPNA